MINTKLILKMIYTLFNRYGPFSLEVGEHNHYPLPYALAWSNRLNHTLGVDL